MSIEETKKQELLKKLADTKSALEFSKNPELLTYKKLNEISETAKTIAEKIGQEPVEREVLNVKFPKTQEITGTVEVKSIDDVVKALKKLQQSMDDKADYTLLFDEIITLLEKPDDEKELIKLQELVSKLPTGEQVDNILAYLDAEVFEKPKFEFDGNGRLLVAVDRVGGGGGMSRYMNNASGTIINPATEETLQSVLSAIGGSEYAQKIQVVGSIIYEAKAVIGSAEASAVWQAWKTDATTLTDITVTWADGDKLFNNIATDLSSLSYS